MKSVCPDERALEAFVLTGATDHEAHIQECAPCRAQVQKLRSIYGLAAAMDSGVVDRFARLLVGRRSSHKLYPVQRLERGGGVRLAAQSYPKGRFEHVMTFGNERGDVLARVVRDGAKSQWRLYLVSEGGAQTANVLIFLEGVDRPLLSNDEGMAVLPEGLDIDFEKTTLRLESAVSEFELKPMEHIREYILAEGHFALQNETFDRIDIEAIDAQNHRRYLFRIGQISGERRLHVVVKGDAGYHRLAEASKGIAVFEDLEIERVLKISVYPS